MVTLAPPPPSSATLLAQDGVRLAYDARGRGPRRPVVFAHGFGQTRRAWDATVARVAAAGHPTLAADARGHGESGWRADGAYALDQFVDDVLALRSLHAEAPVFVGASMGGLTGLLAEAERGPLFAAIVLVDVTPRWEAAGVERILAFMQANAGGFSDLDAAAAAIAAYLPHRREPKSAERLRSLLVERGGRLHWHWDPRLLDRVAAEVQREQPRFPAAARALRIPTLLISGGASDLVSADTVREFRALVPHAEHLVVPAATHMVAGDDNDAFAACVLPFLHRIDAARPAPASAPVPEETPP